MLNSYKEKDFAALRGPLESGRQSPSSLAPIFLLCVFLQPLTFFLANYVGGDETKFTFAFEVKIVHMTLTIILMIMCIVFAIPKVYAKYERTQYLMGILVIQNLGAFFGYIGSIYLFESVFEADVSALNRFAAVTLIIGLFVFIITSIRFNKLLKDGKYRRGGEKDQLRRGFEGKSFTALGIVAGLGIFYTIQAVMTAGTYLIDWDMVFGTIVGQLIFYAMLFVLPEQLVILYCKYRFKSFNYKKNGKLYPFGKE